MDKDKITKLIEKLNPLRPLEEKTLIKATIGYIIFVFLFWIALATKFIK
jgi:hypothetical protein